VVGDTVLLEYDMERVMELLETRCYDGLQDAMKTTQGIGIEYDEDVVCDICRSVGTRSHSMLNPKLLLFVFSNNTRIFFPVAIETAGSWSQQAIELVQETGRHTTVITEDSRETTFLFQRLSMALQRGNMQSHS